MPKCPRAWSSEIFLLLVLFKAGAKRICYDLCNGTHEGIALLLNPSLIQLDRNSARKKLPFGFPERERISCHASNLSFPLAQLGATQASSQCVN